MERIVKMPDINFDIIIHIISLIYNFISSNLISLISLIVAIYVAIQNSAHLDFLPDEKPTWVLAILSSNGKRISNENGMALYSLKLINSSNFDIGYFDLRIVSLSKDHEINFYNKRQLTKTNHIEKFHPSSVAVNKDTFIAYDMPNGREGMLKAHSITNIDLIFTPDKNENNDNFLAVLKVAKRKSIFKNTKYGYINSKYESFSHSFSLDSSSKPDYEEYLKDWNEDKPLDKNQTS